MLRRRSVLWKGGIFCRLSQKTSAMQRRARRSGAADDARKVETKRCRLVPTEGSSRRARSDSAGHLHQRQERARSLNFFRPHSNLSSPCSGASSKVTAFTQLIVIHCFNGSENAVQTSFIVHLQLHSPACRQAASAFTVCQPSFTLTYK